MLAVAPEAERRAYTQASVRDEARRGLVVGNGYARPRE